MRILFKYRWQKGFGRLYNYAIKHNYMITKTAAERQKILLFWREYGLKATKAAFNISRSSLYSWWKIYKDSGYLIASLNPGSQAPKIRRKREVHPKIIQEIKHLRLEVCPNLGKDKVKILLDQFCLKERLKPISASTIGRIIQEKRIYHHRQKISHYGRIHIQKRVKKLRKPQDYQAQDMGDLVEIDTIVKFDFGIKRYIITAVDTHTRYTFAWTYKRANSKNAKDFFTKLNQVFPYPIQAVQTDNGSEFHHYFQVHLQKERITHYWNYPKQPYKNGHIEKYNRTIQDEFIDQHLSLLEDPKVFNHHLMDYLIWYNTERPHWALKLQSPINYLINNHHLSRMCWTDTFSCFLAIKMLNSYIKKPTDVKQAEKNKR